MSRARIALLISLLAVAARPLPAQQPLAPATPAVNSNRPVATLRAIARLVVLDVVVTDGNGNPVQGLKPSDFALTEDGVSQKFASFTEHQAQDSIPAATQPSLPLNTFTVQPPLTEESVKTVIVLNMCCIPSYTLVRGDIQAFMKTIAPGNPIAIMRIDRLGMHLVQGFTADPQRLQDAVSGNRLLPPIPDITCRAPYTGIINPYQRLSRYLAGIPGRINLAWVTDEGMPDDFRGNDYPELTNIVRNLNTSTNVLRLSRVTPYVIKAGGYIGGILQPIPFGDIVADIKLPQIIANSHSDPPPRDLETFPTAQGSLLSNQAMADLATAAGGHAFFDGAGKALTQVMALGSNYYTLSYVPSNANWNGAFRKIAIKVSGVTETGQSRFGWSAYGQPNVVYRRGYNALSKPDPSSQAGAANFGMATVATPVSQPVVASLPGVEPIAPIITSQPKVIPHINSPLEAAMGFGTLTPNQVDFTIVVAPSAQKEKPKSDAPSAKDNFITDSYRNSTYRNYNVHYWIDAHGLKFTRAANGTYRDDLQFVAIVYHDDGLVANSVSVTAHIQASASNLENFLTTGITFDQTIAMPIADNMMAENYFLRVGISETSTGQIGALEVPADWIKLPPKPAANSTAANPTPPAAPPQ